MCLRCLSTINDCLLSSRHVVEELWYYSIMTMVQYEYWSCLLIADIPQCLIDYMTYVTQLEYDQEPDYNLLRNSLKAGMKKERLALDGKLNFTVQVSR